MSIFKKKRKVPKISPIQTLPSPIVNRLEPSISPVQTTELPSLPGNIGQNMNQELVKSAVSEDNFGGSIPSIPITEKVEELPKDFKFEKTNFQDNLLNKPLNHLITPEEITKPLVTEITPKTLLSKNIEKEDTIDKVFVRIDKFQEAKKKLDEINSQVKIVELLAEKIEEVKNEEVSEIEKLGKNLEELKIKLAKVDADIFQRL